VELEETAHFSRGMAAAREKAGLKELVASYLPRRRTCAEGYKTIGYVPAAVDPNAIGIAGYLM
jgi:hypothetical protein